MKPSTSDGTMASQSPETEQLDWRKPELRRSKNPYAWHYFFDEENSGQTLTAHQQYRLGENPHAWHFYFDSGDAHTSAAVTTAGTERDAKRRSTMSKVDFEAACRMVFRPYIPALEKGRLRAHHQEFIRRNRSRSPETRSTIVELLRKYDLSSESGLRTHFNREEDAFTEEKLIRIEKSVSE